MNENRNLVLAIVLCAAVLILWQTLVAEPQARRAREAQLAERAKHATSETMTPAVNSATPAPAAPAVVTRDDALTAAPRIKIETPRVDGSFSLEGARLDDLRLKDYRETTNPRSAEIIVLSPAGAPQSYYAVFGWAAAGDSALALPGEKTRWTTADTRPLTPEHPVVLSYDNGAGLLFTRTIAIDANYMFTVTDAVENKGAGEVSLAPYGLVRREAPAAHRSYFILHEGLLGVVDNELKTST